MDASTTGQGITPWQKQDDGNRKPITFGSRYLNDTELKYSIGELELLTVVWGSQKIPILFIREEGISIYRSLIIGTSNQKKPEQQTIQRATNKMVRLFNSFGYINTTCCRH